MRDTPHHHTKQYKNTKKHNTIQKKNATQCNATHTQRNKQKPKDTRAQHNLIKQNITHNITQHNTT